MRRIVFVNGNTIPIATLGLESKVETQGADFSADTSANGRTRQGAEPRHLVTDEHLPSNDVVQTSWRLMRQWRCHAFILPSLSIAKVVDEVFVLK